MNLSIVDRIANALLYEGYILYPYRASSVKNRLRFNFGVVYPKQYAEAQSGSDAWSMQTQCLATGAPSATVEICVRFLRLIDRELQWQEAMECRVDVPSCSLDTLLAAPVRHEFSEGEIRGVVETSAEAVCGPVHRVTVRIVNTTELPKESTSRDEALSRSLISTHTVLEICNGEFVSLLEPPDALREAAAGCQNIGVWPVLVGQAGEKSTMLASPIILYDYPAIAPESPGDLFDGTEIDEILTLRVLTMTDQEKEEARHTDERSRRILDRAESLDAEQFLKLHGAFRDVGGQFVNEMDWGLLEDRTPLEHLEVGGVRVSPGSRVRLLPRKSGDIFDLALAGQVAIIESLEEDYDGRRHVAVVLENDPGRDLGMLRQPGHRFFFAPDEIEPLPEEH